MTLPPDHQPLSSGQPPYAGPPTPGGQYPVSQPPFGAAPVYRATNGFATASLVLGICGFVLMGIPFFIGWFLGGPPDILAVIFGIIGINRSARNGGIGRGAAVTGLVLGSVSLLSVFIGAGSLW